MPLHFVPGFFDPRLRLNKSKQETILAVFVPHDSFDGKVN